MNDYIGDYLTGVKVRVKVIHKLYSGDIAIEWMHPYDALMVLGHDKRNGGEVISSKIVWGEVNARDWDMSI